MGLHQRVNYSFTFAIVILFLSMFVNFVPCQKAPLVPNQDYNWDFCDLNPDSRNTKNLQKFYFGYTQSISESYIITLISSFALSMTLLTILNKSKTKD